MSKKMRFLSFFLALVMVISSAPVVPVYAQDEASVSGLTVPFRGDVPFTVNGTTVTSNSYRIPAMVTLSDGTIVAAADIRWNTTYDGGGLDTLVARSTDGGKTWRYNAANYLGDNGNQYNGSSSTAFLDPGLVVGADGQTVYMLVDLYPYGVALNGKGHTQPSEKVGFNNDGYLLLSGDNHTSYSYYLKDGKIYNSSGSAVEGYKVDAYFNISGPNGINTNLFCEDSPYKVVRTGYLYLTSSKDGGATWSEPTLLNVKTSSECVCLIAPGSSITTSSGTMIFPVYSYHGDNDPSGNTQRLSFIYSKDGVNWSRSSEFDYNWASEAAVVELNNGTLRFFFRNGSKKLCYVDYNMENGWGSVVTLTDVNTNSNTQISAITYSKTSNGKQIVLVSCPTGPSRNGSNSSSASNRLNGSIFVFTVASNGDMNLENTIYVNEKDNQFIYSCMAERADGSVLILFEDNENGWGTGDNCFYTMDIKGYLPSALGIPLDEPQNIIVDENGNVIDSIFMGQYEKPELTANAPFSASDVNYQWQIEYEPGKWVDIYGEDSKTVKISYGMVATLLGGDGQVDIRCKSTASSQVVYSKPITVTIEMYQPKDPDVVVSESFVSSNGQTVTVTVSGSIPENASVQLEETDSAGVEVKPNETVAAALDISITNANGTEWQPESGETVTVTLEASKIGLTDGDQFVIYHLHKGDVRVLGSYTVENGVVCFDVDGFSKFVFARIEQTISTDDLTSDIGKLAKINEDLYDYIWTVSDPSSITSYTGSWYTTCTESTDYSANVEFTVTDVFVSDIAPYGVFYKVKVNNDSLLTEALINNPWIYQRYLDEPEEYNTLILTDAPDEAEPSVDITVDGQKVTEITVSQNNKVSLTATSTANESASYRWQLLIPNADMWVDISGQTEAICTVNYGMVANRLDANGQAHIRCVTTVDGTDIFSESIAVNIGEIPTYYFPMFRSATSSSADITSVASANTGVMPIADGDEGEGVKYTLTVKFHLGDSDTGLYQPYIAEFKQGEVRTINIPVPRKAGYRAEYNGVEVVDDNIVMEGKSLTENEEIFVRYYPENTKYTVIHKVQNIHNDEYSVYLEETTLYGLTDSQVPDNLHFTEEDLPGFYKIPYVRPTIAADGSTVVEIYYDRYYYLMNFDLGQGGFGVEPAYARYETEISFGTPTRKGYIFKGWTLNHTSVTSPVRMPAYDCTVVANWKASTAEYTIVYWKENAEPDANGTYGYSYWASRVVDATAGDVVSGRDDVAAYVTDEVYFTYNDVRTDKDVLVKGDGSTVVNVYYLRNYYDIYFYVSDNGDNTVNSCQAPTHGHTDGTCTKYLICGLSDDHTHDASCQRLLTCGTAAHTHSSACCSMPVHAEHTSECCTLEENAHTHTRSCYASGNITVSSTNSDTDYRLDDAPNNPAEGYVFRYSNNRRYVYVGGHWYRIQGSSYQTGDIAATYCAGSHTHGDGNCTCALAIHTHTDGTCTCDTTAHTHISSCYQYSCGKVQHTHTDACYSACTKAAHTHNDGNCTNGNGRYLLKIIHAKYDSDISAEWPVASESIDGLKGFAYWSGNSSAGTQSSRVVTMNSDWAKGGGVKVNANYNSTKYQLNYWFEDLDQTDKTTSSTRVLRDGKYYVLSDKYAQVAYYGSTSSWNYKQITGMTATASSASISNGTANLYYNRSTHALTFESYNEEVEKETGVMFEKPLNYYLDDNGNCTVVPDYPTGTLEEGGYYFAGWYSTKECFDGTEFDFATETMPNGDLTLYAKWAPVEHTIEFYFDHTLTQKLSEEDGFLKQVVPHNNYGANPGLPGHPLDFEAIVWFYKDEDGVEHTFDFSMQVKRDMKLYPKWRSNVFIDYEIHYLIEGTNTPIAEPIVGQDLYGESVTFGPKGQDDFYPAYRDGGYFAVTPTHNIVMGETTCATSSPDCDWDENAKKHVFTFYYTEGPTVPYTVRYLDKETGNPIFPNKIVSDNRKAIVVENALIKVGYRPDEAQKSLVVVKGGSNNIITFYYEQDENATYYTVSHYIKKYGTNEYVLYQNATPYNATVGDIVPNQTHIMIDGFTYVVTDNTILGGKVGEIGSNGEPGLEIKMYYDEKPVTINYEVIGNFGGTVSPGSNTLGMVYGTTAGSTATPENETYRFVGWYADWEGKELLSTDAKFVPTKEANEKWIDGTTYYAKFEYNLTSLTIRKEGWNSVDPNQTFLFRLTDEDGLSLIVTVHGNSSVTVNGLTVGKTYQIEELTDWSWRYTNSGVTTTDNKTTVNVTDTSIANGAEFILNPTNNFITFTNTRSEGKWLDGDDWQDNVFGVN
ncbi:MAG: InlB B-repeat-containing protein [Oscillospiraceae bacterium]|nr:InlB B-repeat-containing protein [Oscillospiraceae bacterium]